MIVTQTALIFYFGQDEIDSVKDKVRGFNDTGWNIVHIHTNTSMWCLRNILYKLKELKIEL